MGLRLIKLMELIEAEGGIVKKRVEVSARGIHAQYAEGLRRMMNKKGWTHRKFAKVMGRHRPEITKWLSGRHNFTLDTIRDIEEKTGEKIMYIVWDQSVD